MQYFFWLHARQQAYLGAEVQGDLSVHVVGNTFLLTNRQMLFLLACEVMRTLCRYSSVLKLQHLYFSTVSQ